MELDRLTIKSQAALQEAHPQASARHHQHTIVVEAGGEGGLTLRVRERAEATTGAE